MSLVRNYRNRAAGGLPIGELPVGVNVYIMAQEFEVIEGPVANALLLTTCLSMLTVPLMTSLFNFL